MPAVLMGALRRRPHLVTVCCRFCRRRRAPPPRCFLAVAMHSSSPSVADRGCDPCAAVAELRLLALQHQDVPDRVSCLPR